jgi:hypothetical protein
VTGRHRTRPLEQAGHAAFATASPESLEQSVREASEGGLSQEWAEQLRDLAVGRLQNRELPDEVRLRWGRLALAAVAAKGRGTLPQRAMAEEAAVRASMIQEFGADNTDTARDPSALCSDVLRHLGLPYEDASRLAGEWRTASREEMLRLRRIKNLLTPLVPIRAHLEGDTPDLREIRTWLALHPRLP